MRGLHIDIHIESESYFGKKNPNGAILKSCFQHDHKLGRLKYSLTIFFWGGQIGHLGICESKKYQINITYNLKHELNKTPDFYLIV